VYNNCKYNFDPIPATVITTPVVTNVIYVNGKQHRTISVTVTSRALYICTLVQLQTLLEMLRSLYRFTNRELYGFVRNGEVVYRRPQYQLREPNALNATAVTDVNSCSNTTIITVTANGGTQTGVGTRHTWFNGLGYTTDNTFTVNNTTTATVSYTVKMLMVLLNDFTRCYYPRINAAY
jgi:hypothetical protein